MAQLNPETLRQDWSQTSASQDTAFDRCNVRWWWAKIAGVQTPAHPAAVRGTKVHKQLERFAQSGEHPDATDIGQLATTAIPFIPDPATIQDDQIETYFATRLKSGVTVRGYIDLIVPGESVTDYKTRSSAQWILQPEQLRHDTQAGLYTSAVAGKYGFGADVVFRHLNILTRAPHKCVPTQAVMTPKLRRAIVDRVTANTIAQKQLAKETDPTKVPHNPNACGDYGGCPFRSRCNAHGITTVQSSFGQTNKEKTEMPSIKERLAAKREKAAVVVSTPTVTEAEETRQPQVDTRCPKHTAPMAPSRDYPGEMHCTHAGCLFHTGMVESIEVVGINPPDGTPMDEPQPTPTGKAAKPTDVCLPVGLPGFGGERVRGLRGKETVSKAHAAMSALLEAQAAGCPALLDEYESKSGLPTDRPAKVVELKDDIELMVRLSDNPPLQPRHSQPHPKKGEPARVSEVSGDLESRIHGDSHPRAVPVVVEVPATEPATFELYLFALPVNVPHVSFSAFLAPYERLAAEAHQVSHPRLIEYGKGDAQVLEMLRIALDEDRVVLPRRMVVMTREYPAVQAFLRGVADVVVTGLGV